MGSSKGFKWNAKAVAFGLLVGVVLILRGSLSAGHTPTLKDAKLDSMVLRGTCQFALDLYNEMVEGEGSGSNVFFSPYSVTNALAMTLLGARGKTRQEMLEGLRYQNITESDIHQSMSTLVQVLQSDEDSKFILKTANRLFVQEDYKILKEFLSDTERYYHATAKEVNFQGDPELPRKIINDWVDGQTASRIQDLIPPDVLNSFVRLVLVNAIYFKGEWKEKFSPEATHQAKFYITDNQYVNVDMMNKKGKYPLRYDSSLKAKILQLPYASGDLKFNVVLPSEGVSLSEVEKALTAEKLQHITFHKQEVEVFLPKFKLLQDYSLNEILPKLGIIDLFDEIKADLSGINGGFEQLFVSKVFHKAFLEVNEEGSEAAAASAVIILAGSAAVEEERFIANKPFLFYIQDSNSGLVLFMGKLARPEGLLVTDKEL